MTRRLLLALGLLVLVGVRHAPGEDPSLVERLGFPADARLLIVNADDFGLNHSANVGTEKVLAAGVVASATVMVPCPWSSAAMAFARENKDRVNIGVHTTLTNEWEHYKWGPVLGRNAVPSLCDARGFFHADVMPLYKHVDNDEAVREIKAQVERALEAGVDVTHIDSHMGAMQYSAVLHERYLRLAHELDLPCRMPGADQLKKYGQKRLAAVAQELDVLHPDVLLMGDPPSIEATESWWKARMAGIETGKVTEVFIHCAVDTPEMRATTGSTRRRVADTDFFAKPETRQFVLDQGIEIISYRELRHLQRQGEPMPRVTRYGWE